MPRASAAWCRRCRARRWPSAATGSLWKCIRAPSRPMSDGAQSLNPKQFAGMMQELQPYLKLWKESRVTEAAATV